MGGEDFAYYVRQVPGAFFRLGVRPSTASDWPALHNPAYDFNDAALPTAIAMHCGVAVRLLADPPRTLCG
jgi:metal-dependent amidase/aminoacylase/carboxypeptidase family protein